MQAHQLVDIALAHADGEQSRPKDSLADGATLELAGRRGNTVFDCHAVFWIGPVKHHCTVCGSSLVGFG